MVLDHFHLTRPPFDAAPDAAFYFEDAAHGELLGALQYALKLGDGIIKVTGEAGSGKSMVCTVLAARLAQAVPPVRMVRISGAAPGLANASPQEVMYAISRQLGVAPERKRTDELMRLLGSYLAAARAAGKLAALAIEEAQALPLETLESLRYLTNLDDGTQKLLPIMLMGSPELNHVLRQPRLRQTRERITLSFVVPPVPRELMPDLLEFRMQAAGYRNGMLFEPDAAKLLARNAGSDMRRLMALADKALHAAANAGALTVTVNDARLAIRGKAIPAPAAPAPPASEAVPAAPLPEAPPEPVTLPPPPPPSASARSSNTLEPEPSPMPAYTWAAAILPTAVKNAKPAPDSAPPAQPPADHIPHTPLTKTLAQVALADEQARLAAAARLMMGRPETPKTAAPKVEPVFTMEPLPTAPPVIEPDSAQDTAPAAASTAPPQRSLPRRALAVSAAMLAVAGVAAAAFLLRPAALSSLAVPAPRPVPAAPSRQPSMMALPPAQPEPAAAPSAIAAAATNTASALSTASASVPTSLGPSAGIAAPVSSGTAPAQPASADTAAHPAQLATAGHETIAHTAAPATKPGGVTAATASASAGPAQAPGPEARADAAPAGAHVSASLAAGATPPRPGLLKQSLLASKTWMRDEPEANFCIQIENVAASDAVRAEQLLADARAAIGLGDIHSHSMLINGEPRIAIVYGSFTSARKALDVQAKLSERWGTRLKIRTIRGIRAAAQEAEKPMRQSRR